MTIHLALAIGVLAMIVALAASGGISPSLVPPVQDDCCPEGEVFKSCGTACPLTCDAPTPRPCTEQCVRGCFCPKGKFRNARNECVSIEQCPDVPPSDHSSSSDIPTARRYCCPEGEVYWTCGTACPLTCDARKPRPCTEQCVRGCFCPDGMLRNARNECVSIDQCPGIPLVQHHCCPEGEIFKRCGTACPLTCDAPTPRPCTRQCVRGCFCPDGMLRNARNECVSIEQCPGIPRFQKCPKGEVFKRCGTACPLTCDTPTLGPCTKNCVTGCFCRDGMLRNAQNKCISVEQCPGVVVTHQCPNGTIFNKCGTACPPTCDTPRPFLCTLQCVIGCFCPRGMLQKNGECVAPDQCNVCNYNGDTYQNGDTFNSTDGCNKCTCIKGYVACTRRACKPRVPIRLAETRISILGQMGCTHLGKTYKPGQSFPAGDGCNTCLCTNTGLATCTLKLCFPKTGCIHCGVLYKEGDNFTAGDGCNTCFCRGGLIACTEKGCSSQGCMLCGVQYKEGDNFTAEDGCNTCFCWGRLVTCTEKACPPQGCMHFGIQYKEGDNFTAEDGCNTCFCRGRLVTCTEKACPSQGCIHRGVIRKEGSSFKADDGCNNTCYCSSGTVSCTEIGCLPPVCCCGTAHYNLSLHGRFTRELHPYHYPRNPHFSPVIGAVHSDSYTMWREFGLASPGVQSVCETGSASTLRSEMQMAKGIHSVIVRGGISVGDGEVHTEFTIDCSHPLISVISMIAPSPDWIVGVHDLRLCRHDGWMKEYHAILPGYDCGTDSGECYTCPDAPEDPHQMMRELTKKTITNRDSSFYDPNGGFISPFGTLWLKLLNVTGGCPTTEGPDTLCTRMKSNDVEVCAGRVGCFITSCESDGSFSTQQCHASTGYCWCVDTNGSKIEGTDTPPFLLATLDCTAISTNVPPTTPTGEMTTTVSTPKTPTKEPLQCHFCAQTSEEDCDKFQFEITCSTGEMCAVVKTTLPQNLTGAVVAFQRGCMSNCSDSDQCHGAAGGDCVRCCDTNLCNNFTIPMPTLPTTELRRQCFVCADVNKDDCDKNRFEFTCSLGEVCRLVVNTEAQVLGGRVQAFVRDCASKADCLDSDGCLGDFGGNCIRCCDNDFCNDGDIDTMRDTNITEAAMPRTVPTQNVTQDTNTTEAVMPRTVPTQGVTPGVPDSCELIKKKIYLERNGCRSVRKILIAMCVPVGRCEAVGAMKKRTVNFKCRNKGKKKSFLEHVVYIPTNCSSVSDVI